MGPNDKLKQILDKLYTETGASFSGVFRKDNEEIIKTIYPEKKKNLSELIKLIIERGHQTNEIIENFGEEYIYAEGKDISIFVIFVTPEISIASIIEGDAKFALLKLVHVAAAKKIKEILATPEEATVQEVSEQPQEEFKKEYTEEKSTEETSFVSEEKTEEKSFEELIGETPEIVSLEEEIPELVQENKNEITIEDVRDKFAEELEALEESHKEELPEDLHELESILSTPSEIEEKKSEEKKPEEFKKEEEIFEGEIPSLEEILGVPEAVEQQTKQENIEEEPVKETEEKEEKESEQELEPIFHAIEEYEYYDPSVLDKIREELVMEIGPVGNFLFKKRLKELDINPEKITQKDLDNLIKKLLTDIIDTKRRENFIKKTSKFL
ncbi:hypothetical protein [Persephonella sp. KM09-Lau-8]|uniref:hypothetical protein n=1 Tax=Persephonella sp. KM09-Lau-8 TaxID=1158345 RepID=UPI00055D65DE|nr:hypothetical protein [Persephonella sp. KM09-Lau-8]